MRSRVILIIAAAALVVVLVLLGVGDQLLVNLLWFRELGYGSVFATTLSAQAAIFAAVWLVSFAVISASGLAALALAQERERLHVIRRPDDLVEVNLPELLRRYGERIPWRLLVVGAAALLAIFVAQGEAGSWDVYLKGFFGVPFGRTDPAFGRDLGFYIFRLPLLEDWRDLFLSVLFLAAAMAGAVYWARGTVDFRETPPRIGRGAAAHLSFLFGLFFVQRAFSYWLGRFELTLHSDGVVFGLRYIDHLLWEPGLWLLVVLSLLAALICIANLRNPGLKLPVVAAVVVFGPSLLLNLAQPAIEGLWVKPDQLRIERPYLARNIALTRSAFKLDTVDVKPFAGRGQLTRASLVQDTPTIDNIRLWDPRPLIATYRQLQEIRLYYDFHDIDIDRYWVGGKYTQVMLSARELSTTLLPQEAQTWVNRRLKFTHGYGLVMSPVNRKDVEGMPVFYIKDIPPTSDAGLKVTQPGIYFGEEHNSYAIVDAAAPEFDYPQGAGNVFAFYKGRGGIPLAGLWRRLLFSYFFRDINLLVSEAIVGRSRILIRRNIGDRVATLAPFLIQDRDPYMVLYKGRLVWIIDCYTTSDHYPYSQRTADGINYIRNSVKVVIDAYSGATDFYVADPSDPVIRTWQQIFPAMFRPLSEMTAGLRAHVRYPEDFFLIQADIYRTYHMTDPEVFYNREDQWSFPRENYAGETVMMQPYYVIMRLPGETQAEYILMLPMVPHGRDNMIAWIAARCDGADYGHLFQYAFSKDKLFYGPYQVQARINQNPDISRQLSLWNQMGSKVILGNLLVIPIAQSLLYVEPLYIRAETGQLPELQRVIASDSERTVMGDTLDYTLSSLFGEAMPVPATTANLTAAQPAAPAAVAKLAPDLSKAAAHYERALAALKGGDWTAFGTEMQALGRELGQPASAAPSSAP